MNRVDTHRIETLLYVVNGYIEPTYNWYESFVSFAPENYSHLVEPQSALLDNH